MKRSFDRRTGPGGGEGGGQAGRRAGEGAEDKRGGDRAALRSAKHRQRPSPFSPAHTAYGFRRSALLFSISFPVAMPRNLLIAAVIGALTCATPWPATAQAVDRAHTIVIVVGALASQPIPTLVHDRWNQDAADLLFLRLARLGPTMVTAGDKGFEPQLAKSWSRQDSLTLIFNLDPRARWHDGHPVTAKDVVFTFGLFRDPKIDPQHSLLLRSVASVNAEGDHRVIIRFTHYYP